jgi:PAS domain S-box-containing protein
MANSAPALIWTRGTDAGCDWFNDPWLAFTGRTMEQELGDGWSEGVHPEDRERYAQTYRDAFASRTPFTVEFRLRRHDGEYRWVLDNGVPLFEGHGFFKGYVGSCIDITEMKHTQIERERLVTRLKEANSRQRGFLREMLLGFTEGRLRLCDSETDLPAPLAPLAEPIELTAPALRLLRERVETIAEGLRLPRERAQDIETAVHEAAMNAVRHAGGGTACVRGDQETGVIQVSVEDRGAGIAEEMIHRAVERGWTTGGFGHGFFLMHRMADRVYLLTGSRGTTILLEQGRTPAQPGWL